MPTTEDDIFGDLEFVPPDSDRPWAPKAASASPPGVSASARPTPRAFVAVDDIDEVFDVLDVEVEFEDFDPAPTLPIEPPAPTKPYGFAPDPRQKISDVGIEGASPLSLANAVTPGAPTAASGDMAVALARSDNAPAAPQLSSDPAIEMEERFALGDYSGALLVAESILDEDGSHAGALSYSESCRDMLAKMYSARLGPMDRVPVVLVPREQLKWLSLDHRAGFVLSLVDGVSSLEQILDVSGMSALDTLRILFEISAQRVIGFR